MKTEKQIAAAAAAFAGRWKGRGYERGESQLFWADLLSNVYGVKDLSSFIRYEEQVSSMVDSTNFIDGHIPSTKVLIEQKSINKDLRKGLPQSDGSVQNPFQQAKRYVANMPLSEHPRWIVTCNFKEFLIYDMEQPNGEPEQILLENLDKEYYRLQFLVDAKSEHISKEMQVSMKAGEIVGRIYDALLKQYDDNSPVALRWLNILCVRIVFCLYAEDAGVFSHDQFHDFLNAYDAKDMRRALADLFMVLNTPVEKRSRYLADDLKAFPYTNGGLFEEEIEIPQFTEKLKQTLLQNASLDFDWSEISPTIFGAVFESTLNPETRRSGGMHYTSIENIHKVIDPLFLNDLRRELDEILEVKEEKKRLRRFDEYQDKLATLTFLDPACGSGNFLTETYLSLRRLENEVIRERYHGQSFLGLEGASPVKVSIHQFYGIEINDFAVTVATTALWISEAQMLTKTEQIVQHDIDFLPLKSYANIKEGNALRVSWTEWEISEQNPVIIANKTNVYPTKTAPVTIASEAPAQYESIDLYSDNLTIHTSAPEPPTYHVDFDYIMSNPPFVGAQYMTKEQKTDLMNLFPKNKHSGELDFVAGWYKKAANLMNGSDIRCAFVSTNSITQGEQVAALWEELFENGIHFDFAYRTFRWDSEASLKAHVHCVIIGFSCCANYRKKIIYSSDSQCSEVNNINAYLLDAINVFIGSRSKPICDVPQISKGCQPTDGGNLIIEEKDYEEFVKKEPGALKFIKKLVGAQEFINNKKRYCLWLVDASPAELRKMPLVMKRIEACREMRLKSTDKATRKLAETPTVFRETYNPKTFIIVPSTSSERRRYIPMGFLDENTISTNSNLIIPEATLYHFGVLTSNVHMAWMRAVAGRLKSDYRYSKDIVYNNFPWCQPTDEQKARIESAAQGILDARCKFPDCSLADLYNESLMPPELRRAHQENDKAVMQAYGFDPKILVDDNEAPIVAELFKLYQTLTK